VGFLVTTPFVMFGVLYLLSGQIFEVQLLVLFVWSIVFLNRLDRLKPFEPMVFGALYNCRRCNST